MIYDAYTKFVDDIYYNLMGAVPGTLFSGQAGHLTQFKHYLQHYHLIII